MEFLILSKDRSQSIATWLCKNSDSYTTDIDAAGRYSAEEYATIVRAGHDKYIRVPVSVIDRAVTTHRIVDFGDANNHSVLMAFDGA